MNIIKLFNVMGNYAYNKGDGDDNVPQGGHRAFLTPKNISFPSLPSPPYNDKCV